MARWELTDRMREVAEDLERFGPLDEDVSLVLEELASFVDDRAHGRDADQAKVKEQRILALVSALVIR